MVSLGYMAGFLDADGSIGIYKHHIPGKKGDSQYQVYQLKVSISNTNRDVIEFLQGEFGGSIIEISRSKKKISFELRFNPRESEALLRQILPYLIVKKRQASIALSFRKEIVTPRGGRISSRGRPLSPETLERREALYREILFLNSGWRGPE